MEFFFSIFRYQTYLLILVLTNIRIISFRLLSNNIELRLVSLQYYFIKCYTLFYLIFSHHNIINNTDFFRYLQTYLKIFTLMKYKY